MGSVGECAECGAPAVRGSCIVSACGGRARGLVVSSEAGPKAGTEMTETTPVDGWEYVGITSYHMDTVGGGGMEVESCRAVLERAGEARGVTLSDENRVGPASGGGAGDGRLMERVGVVTDYKDGGEFGLVYAEPDPGPDGGPAWYWVPLRRAGIEFEPDGDRLEVADE